MKSELHETLIAILLAVLIMTGIYYGYQTVLKSSIEQSFAKVPE